MLGIINEANILNNAFLVNTSSSITKPFGISISHYSYFHAICTAYFFFINYYYTYYYDLIVSGGDEASACMPVLFVFACTSAHGPC
jgi:hypothetical protein